MSTATDMRDLYLAAEEKVLAGQSVEMNGRRLTRADLGLIRAGRMEWERRANAESRTSVQRGAAFADFSDG
jgi:hypothetical protein